VEGVRHGTHMVGVKGRKVVGAYPNVGVETHTHTQGLTKGAHKVRLAGKV
jgi:hypothetical protein